MRDPTKSDSDARAKREWRELGERVVRRVREQYAALIDRLESQARDCGRGKDGRK